MLENDREAYESFFQDFGRGIKYGIYSSYGMDADKLSDLLLFYSASEKKMITLAEYLEKAAKDQSSIFYAVGESVDRLAKMPIVKTVLDKGYDVLLCTQDVDEFCMMAMNSFDERPLKNVAGGDLDLETEDEKEAAEAITKENESLFAAMKGALGDAVVRVAVSTRLSDAPAAVTTQGPISLEMERMMAMGPDGEKIKADRVLELNPKHRVFDVLKQAEADGDTAKIELYSTILYDQALIIENMPIEDPVAYAQAVTSLME